MKPVKSFVFAALLVFSIALNTFAGDIDLPGKTPEPPHITATGETTGGTTPDNTDSQPTVETSDYLFLETLAALLSVY